MKYMKEKSRVISFSLAILLLALFAMPSTIVAQELEGPVRLQYAGDMKAKYEGEKLYIYTYRNKYEGDTCTSADGATRVHIPSPSIWLRMLVKVK